MLQNECKIVQLFGFYIDLLTDIASDVLQFDTCCSCRLIILFKKLVDGVAKGDGRDRPPPRQSEGGGKMGVMGH